MPRNVPNGFYTEIVPPDFCPVCEIPTDADHWTKNYNVRNRNGFSWLCIARKNQRNKGYYSKAMADPQKRAARKDSDRVRYLKDPLYIRWKAYRSCDARMYGGVTISWDEAHVLMIGPCYYCKTPESGGLDRKDSNLGHSVENVVSCCASCNNILGDIPYAAKMCLAEGLREINNRGLLNEWLPPTMRRNQVAIIQAI